MCVCVCMCVDLFFVIKMEKLKAVEPSIVVRFVLSSDCWIVAKFIVFLIMLPIDRIPPA